MTPYPLSKSDFSSKVLITIFLLSMVAAFGVAELNVYDKVGRVRNGVEVRYGPDRHSADISPEKPGFSGAVTAPENSESQTVELQNVEPLDAESQDVESLPFEDEAPVARLNTFTALLDATHPHVFELPIVMLVLAHFLMRTRVSASVKLANYIAAFGGIVIFLSAPWLVRYVSSSAAPLLFIGAGSIGVAALSMILISIFDIWLPAANRVPVRSAVGSPVQLTDEA